MRSKKSQDDEVLELFQSGRSLTGLEALQVMNNKTMNLRNCVSRLRARGFPIGDRREKTPGGKSVKRYFWGEQLDFKLEVA